MESNFKITHAAPKNESGLVQLIMIGEFIRQIWVRLLIHTKKKTACVKTAFTVLRKASGVYAQMTKLLSRSLINKLFIVVRVNCKIGDVRLSFRIQTMLD